MGDIITPDIVRSLPVPTDEQWRAFEKHLITVHSWYKHLPLFKGGEFIVFLDPKAGEGYPLEHPKLPTENSTKGYRQAFGHLNYMYRTTSDAPFDSDGGRRKESLHLDNELEALGSFYLYPFVHDEFYWSIFEDDIDRIRHGEYHPHAEDILAAYNASQQLEEYDELSYAEWNLTQDISDEEREVALQERSHNDRILRYLELEAVAYQAYNKLQQLEIDKIRHCISNLRQWLT